MEVTAERDRYALTVLTQPTVEPLTATEAMLHLRVTATEEDHLIRRLVVAARVHSEKIEGRTYMDTVLVLRMDKFPDTDGAINLPRPPARSVTSIVYIDTTGATATLAAADYTVDIYSTPGRIVPAYDESWPSTRDELNAVTVTYRAGFATTATGISDDRKAAMLLLVGHWYANRENVVVGTISSAVAVTVDALLGMDRGSYL